MSINYTIKENLQKANEFNKLETASLQIFSALLSGQLTSGMSTKEFFELIELSTTLASGLLDECNYIRLKTNKHNEQ